MAAGIILGPNDVNNAIGGISRNLNVALAQQVPQVYAVLAGIGGAGLQAAPYSFSSADAANIMTVIEDLNNLYKIYTGAMYVTNGATPGTGVPTVGNGYDFRVFASRVWGFGY